MGTHQAPARTKRRPDNAPVRRTRRRGEATASPPEGEQREQRRRAKVVRSAEQEGRRGEQHDRSGGAPSRGQPAKNQSPRRKPPRQSRRPAAPDAEVERHAAARAEPKRRRRRPQRELVVEPPPVPSRYIAVGEDTPATFVEPMQTEYLSTMSKVQALAVTTPDKPADPSRGLAEVRGYRREDLMAVAEIAYHYLFSGGLELARTLYEGLSAVQPEEPYYALALGLTYDRLDDKPQAERWYRTAAQLDPADGRADVNRAELYLEGGDFVRAAKLLRRGVSKASLRRDAELARKTTAILSHLEARAAKTGVGNASVR